MIFWKLQMTKVQITNKSQIQIFNDQNIAGFEFGIWGLKFVCYLWFEFWDFGCKENLGNKKNHCNFKVFLIRYIGRERSRLFSTDISKRFYERNYSRSNQLAEVVALAGINS